MLCSVPLGNTPDSGDIREPFILHVSIAIYTIYIVNEGVNEGFSYVTILLGLFWLSGIVLVTCVLTYHIRELEAALEEASSSGAPQEEIESRIEFIQGERREGRPLRMEAHFKLANKLIFFVLLLHQATTITPLATAWLPNRMGARRVVDHVFCASVLLCFSEKRCVELRFVHRMPAQIGSSCCVLWLW